MKTLYLIRHGQPDFPGGKHMCLGRTDIPLSTLGRLQSCLLGRALNDRGVSEVCCSFLSRSRETALFISPAPVTVPGLEEMSAGDWDGLSFDEIRRRWPDIYERRGEEYVPIPNSEDPGETQRRFAAAMRRIAQSCGNICAVVAHTAVINSFVGLLRDDEETNFGAMRQPYCSWRRVEYDGEFRLAGDIEQAHPVLDDELCFSMLRAANAPQPVISHCRAVADEAQRIAEALRECGVTLDVPLIRRSALLHDIARTRDDHAALGAHWLRELGYAEESDIVMCHHDLPSAEISERAVVYIADKCVSGDKLVTIDARFAASAEKCRDKAALAAHARRYAEADVLRRAINGFCGRELVH